MKPTESLPAGECDLLRQLRESPDLFAEIGAFSGEKEFALQQRLRKNWPADLVRGALQLAELRHKARAKFAKADEMWFDAIGLEQATSETVSRHKAARFAVVSSSAQVFDLCCGIGGDALALAQVADVIAVDRNPVQCLRTEWNVALHVPSSRLQTIATDVESLDLPSDALVHIDPDQRSIGQRSRRLELAAPALPFLQSLTQRTPGGAIKLSPASNFGGKFGGCEIELVTWNGECREATVWFGDLRRAEPMRATRLPENVTIAGDPWADTAELSEVRRYVFDPDPSIVRAGLVDRLAVEHSLSRLDAAEEYLTADDVCDSPFVSAFEVVETVPNNDRKVRDAVRQQGWHEIEIKCRHLSISADEIRRKLPLEGTGRGVLLYARIAGKATAILARRV